MRLLNKFKSLSEWWQLVIIIGVVFVIVVSPIIYHSTASATYYIDSPTKEQMELIMEGNPEYRVWFNDAKRVYQGSSIIIVEMRVRVFEGERIPEFFDEIGVNYKRLKRLK